jgi:hypothetical protein
MNGNGEVSDHDVLRAVRGSLSGVPVPGPPRVEAIIARGRARRRRRLIPGMAVLLALAAGAALTVTALAPASHQAGHPPSARLAAWTVARQADGNIRVTIRELRDSAGLQRRLRTDGVPANVTFFGQLPRSCRRYPASPALINKVFTVLQRVRFPIMARRLTVMVIHPSALPSGAGIAITPNGLRVRIQIAVGLVHANPRCAGS